MTTAAASAPRTVKLVLLGFGNMAREFCALAERERESLPPKACACWCRPQEPGTPASSMGTA